MRWLIVVLLLVAPALGACQKTPEFVRAALCEPVPDTDPVEPVEPGGLLPAEAEPSGW